MAKKDGRMELTVHTIPIVIGLDPDAVVVPVYDSARYDNSDIFQVHWFNCPGAHAEMCVSVLQICFSCNIIFIYFDISDNMIAVRHKCRLRTQFVTFLFYFFIFIKTKQGYYF